MLQLAGVDLRFESLPRQRKTREEVNANAEGLGAARRFEGKRFYHVTRVIFL